MDKTNYSKDTVKRYLEDLSARRMVPGGGSVSALSAALGAALNLMVINYSVKEGKTEATLTELRSRQQTILETLESLIDEDCRVFGQLMKVLSEKKDADKEYRDAAMVPLSVCNECIGSIAVTKNIIPYANADLKSDIGCAFHVLKGAFYSAKLNVDINLKFIKDDVFVEGTKEDIIKKENQLLDMEKDIIGTI